MSLHSCWPDIRTHNNTQLYTQVRDAVLTALPAVDGSVLVAGAPRLLLPVGDGPCFVGQGCGDRVCAMYTTWSLLTYLVRLPRD